jgi:23S rRNA-/tRNA-specific pseudouridylate synthase
MSEQFSLRAVKKNYLALVDTRTNAFEGQSSGTLTTGWAKVYGYPSIVPVDTPDSKQAVTDWRILGSSVSLLTPIHRVCQSLHHLLAIMKSLLIPYLYYT